MRKLTAVAVAVSVLGVAAPGPGQASESTRIRKEVTTLTSVERDRYIDAVLKLKEAPSPYDADLSWYDQFVAWHVFLASCEFGRHRTKGHAGPMFLPWHRQFVLLFEDALRAVGHPDVTVPYWDWTDSASTASVFADDFMGGDGDPDEGFAVTTGPFADWTLNVHNDGLIWGSVGTSYLSRRFGWEVDPLPTQAEVEAVLAVPAYDVPPYDDSSDSTQSFRNAVEGYHNPVGGTGCSPDGTHGTVATAPVTMHNKVHMLVGGVLPESAGRGIFGTMAVPSASPNDPVFFLHHSQIDRLWARWQDAHGVDTYRPVTGYPHDNVHAVMQPFDAEGIVVAPADVADVRGLGYRYDDQAG